MSKKPTKIPKRLSLAYRGDECLNCSHPLDVSDKYCPNCSQINSTKKIVFKDLFNEFFASIISYDSKLIKTLSALIFRPGKISKDYIRGKRLTYTNPFRFFLSLTFVYFIMISLSNNFSDLDKMARMNNSNETNFFKGKESVKNKGGLDILIQSKKKKNDSILSLDPKLYFNSIAEKSFFPRFFKKIEYFQSGIKKNLFFTFDEAINKLKIINSTENNNAFSIARSAIKIETQPSTFINYLISKIPFILFFFLPIFALFIWIIYNKKLFTYMDHLIFGFHNQSMLILLLIISFVINYIFKKDFSPIASFIFLFYLYKAMRKFYEERRFKTILKFLFLNFTFFILASLITTLYIFSIALTY